MFGCGGRVRDLRFACAPAPTPQSLHRVWLWHRRAGSWWQSESRSRFVDRLGPPSSMLGGFPKALGLEGRSSQHPVSGIGTRSTADMMSKPGTWQLPDLCLPHLGDQPRASQTVQRRAGQPAAGHRKDGEGRHLQCLAGGEGTGGLFCATVAATALGQERPSVDRSARTGWAVCHLHHALRLSLRNHMANPPRRANYV